MTDLIKRTLSIFTLLVVITTSQPSIAASEFDDVLKLYDAGNYEESYKFFSNPELQENPEARYYLGLHYMHGLGVEQNTKLAYDHISYAAESGYERAFAVAIEITDEYTCDVPEHDFGEIPKRKDGSKYYKDAQWYWVNKAKVFDSPLGYRYKAAELAFDNKIDEAINYMQKAVDVGAYDIRTKLIDIKSKPFFSKISKIGRDDKLDLYMLSEDFKTNVDWLNKNYESSFDCKSNKKYYQTRIRECPSTLGKECESWDNIGDNLTTNLIVGGMALLTYHGKVLEVEANKICAYFKKNGDDADYTSYFSKKYKSQMVEIISLIEEQKFISEYTSYNNRDPEFIKMLKDTVISIEDSVGEVAVEVFNEEELKQIKKIARLNVKKKIINGGCANYYIKEAELN